MLRRTLPALLIAAGALLAGFAAPAHAADPPAPVQTGSVKVVIHVPHVAPEAYCEVSGGGGLFFDPPYDDWITAYDYYSTDPTAPGLYAWDLFRYELDGVLLSTNSHSNVNIRMTESGTLKFAQNSPDDRHARTWYYVRPASPIYTRGGSVTIQFEAIFDRSGGSDPRCVARTKA